jgi:galactonate dehydratase
MKITDMKIFVVGNPWKNWVFLKIYTDDGVTGLGEATGGLTTKPAVGLLEELKHLIVGHDPRDIRKIRDIIHKALFLHDADSAGAGIDCACWDILGKSLGVPVYRLLGGRMRESLRVYANGWYKGPREPKFFGERAKQIADMGYTALKFDPFGNNYMFMCREEEKLSMSIIESVRLAVGEDVDILIEGHDRFSIAQAVRLGQMMEQYNPMWFETPTLSSDPEAIDEVARKINVSVISGERAKGPSDIARALQGRAISMANPEYLGVGGISGLMDCFAIARAYNAYLAPHNAQSPLSTAINVHVGAANDNLLIQECFDDSAISWARDILTGYPVVKDGYIAPSEAPGLGVELNEDEALKHPYGERNFLRLFESGWECRNS